jgi:hypothetical protein
MTRRLHEREGPFGGRFWEDDDGNTNSEIPGTSGPLAVDADGNRTRLVTGPFGGRRVETDSATPILPEQPAPARRFSLPRSRSFSSSNDDDTWSGIGFLLGALFVLVVVILFVYIGVPILAGVWLAKFVNRRWDKPVPDRHRWRWAILPAAFAAGALPTNELVATGFGALNCSDPQSVPCANYRLAPTPTVLGLHRWLVQRDSIASQPLARLRASDPRARINLRNQPSVRSGIRWRCSTTAQAPMAWLGCMCGFQRPAPKAGSAPTSWIRPLRNPTLHVPTLQPLPLNAMKRFV